MIAGALRLIVAAVALFSMGTGAAGQAQMTPHSVPLEFASDRYGVTVNGKPVTVFYAAMNIHFASFDFTGQADVRVTINENDYNRHDFKPLIKPDDFWQGKSVVRPLSRYRPQDGKPPRQLFPSAARPKVPLVK